MVSTSMETPRTSESRDELLPRGVALVTGVGEECDRGLPLPLGGLDVLDEAVQVPDQRLEDPPEAGVGGAGQAGADDLGRSLLGEELSQARPHSVG
jgi:hypothetical protein